ncbi:MAG: phosphate-starvation-inducible PsiE family protein [Rhodocyclaceae bacterium]|nr:phosphate-starvation-inducible PsiE family protein [Rhodocyclaceae bacterium]
MPPPSPSTRGDGHGRRRQGDLADLLLMFLYLEVLAMIGQYFRSATSRCVIRSTSPWWRWRAI